MPVVKTKRVPKYTPALAPPRPPERDSVAACAITRSCATRRSCASSARPSRPSRRSASARTGTRPTCSRRTRWRSACARRSTSTPKSARRRAASARRAGARASEVARRDCGHAAACRGNRPRRGGLTRKATIPRHCARRQGRDKEDERELTIEDVFADPPLLRPRAIAPGCDGIRTRPVLRADQQPIAL